MVENISDLFKHPGNPEDVPKTRAPDTADVHAMAASLKQKETPGDINSLFSGRIKPKPSEAETDRYKLEHKLSRYKSLEKNPEDDREPKDDQPQHEDPALELAREVADQILAGGRVQGDVIGQNEVIIRIKNNILKGCRIHLIKEKDCLQIRVYATTRQTLQTLVEARHSLEELLEKNYKGLIRLSFHRISPKPDVKDVDNA